MQTVDIKFRDDVKAELDRECPNYAFKDRDICRTPLQRKPSIVWPYCFVCHKNDALADRIAEIKERHDR